MLDPNRGKHSVKGSPSGPVRTEVLPQYIEALRAGRGSRLRPTFMNWGRAFNPTDHHRGDYTACFGPPFQNPCQSV